MAEMEWPTADSGDAPDDLESPATPEAVVDDVETSSDATPPAAQTEDTFFDPAQLSPELQDQWKKMQASFTRARQKDRETARAAQEKAQLVDRMNSDPAFAKDLITFLAPKVGLALAGSGSTPTTPATPQASPLADTVMAALTDRLGPELAFLAPALAEAVQQATKAAVSPLERQAAEQVHLTRAQQEAARKAEEDRLMAELDAQYPAWEAEYGTKMEALDAFLASDQLTHPEFGNKYQLYLRLLSPDTARVSAIKQMGDAARRGVRTGRAGQPTQSNIQDRIRQAHQEKGWNEMWKIIQQNPDAITEALQ